MSKEQEPSTQAVGGTPWKGRLRPHHAAPLSLPSLRLPSRAKNRDQDAQTFNKHAAPKNPGRRRNRDEDDGAARPPRIPQRQSSRLTGRDPEGLIVIDGASKECEVNGNKSAIAALRRSPRFHPDDKSSRKPLVEKESYQKQPSLPPNLQEIAHNRKTRNAFSKGKNRENPTRRSKRNAAAKPLARMKSPKEPQRLGQDSEDISPRRKIAYVSCKKDEMQELKPNQCEVLTRKRKTGTEGRPSSRKQNHQEPKSLPPDCQEIAPSIEPRNTIHRKSENDPSSIMQPKIGEDRLMNAEENNEELSGMKVVLRQFCGSDDWIEEQDMALRQAYFTARPSPHFWKKVSKMVPGKSAEECFNRVHADLSTPTPIATRPRTSKTKFSPLGHFTLSDTKFPNLMEPTVTKQRTAKQKSLAARKTVRHLLKKHCLIDKAHEADHFSVFETSPTALQLNISFEDSPGTPDNYLNSGSLHKCSESSSAQKKPLPKLKTKQAEPSPAVLKPVKNVILHEKYIDQLSRREGTKRLRKKAAGTKANDSVKTLSEQQAGGLKTVRNALISEATDFISHFKKLQANSLANVMENSEDDDCDTIDSCHDDDE